MKNNVLYESSILDEGECLAFFSLGRNQPDQPSHYHKEYELCLLPDGVVAQLNIGEAAFALTGPCLILLAPGLPHGWLTRETGGYMVRFPADLLGEKFLGKQPMRRLAKLFEKARCGILLQGPETEELGNRFISLKDMTGFDALLTLLGLLHDLSENDNKRILLGEPPAQGRPSISEARINSAMDFMKTNFFHPLSLEDVARKARMTKGAFCRSIMKKTGKTYAESLSEIRIGHVCRMLLTTSENVSELAYKAGYNNVNHFHRTFRRLKGCTPKEFREANSPGR